MIFDLDSPSGQAGDRSARRGSDNVCRWPCRFAAQGWRRWWLHGMASHTGSDRGATAENARGWGSKKQGCQAIDSFSPFGGWERGINAGASLPSPTSW